MRIYQDGDQHIMENSRVIFGISSKNSGTINYAYNKVTKNNMVLYSPANSGFGGMFQDRFYPGNYDIRDMYRYIPYKTEIISNNAKQLQLRLIGYGKNGIYSNIKIEKIYTLAKDSSILQVDYTISNGKDNVVPLQKGFWSAHGINVPEGYNRISAGSYRTSVTPGFRQLSTRDLSDSWFGIMANDSCLTILSPWDRLKEIYYWSSGSTSGTMECKMGIYPIKAGESLSFTMYLALFSGIGVPDKVAPSGAGSFNLAPEYQDFPTQLQAAINLFNKGKYTIAIYGGVLNKDKVDYKFLAEKTTDNETIAIIPFKPLKDIGTHVYKAEIRRDKNLCFTVFASTIMKKSSGLYQKSTPGEKLPDASAKQEKLNLDFHSLSYKTPHIKWGKPFAGGKIKVLAINSATGGIRDMVELAQRFDMDLTTNYTVGLWSLGDHVLNLNEKDCLTELSKKLTKNYDCIVVSYGMWEVIGKELSDIILNKVANGTGLIVVDPVTVPEKLKPFISSSKGKLIKCQKLNNTGKSNVIAGLPLNILPFGRIRKYDTFGTSLINSDNTPLLGTFNYGKGKVYALSYVVAKGTKSMYNRTASFFLPLLNFETLTIPEYAYYEYQMALFGRLLYDVSNHKSTIDFGNITVKNSKTATVEIECNKPQQLDYELTLRNKFSKVVKTYSGKITSEKGKNVFEINLIPEMNGLHFADLIIRSKVGVEWFGSVTFENKTKQYIKKVNFENRIYKKSESLQLTVDYSGEGNITHSLLDSEGNEFAKAQGKNVRISLNDCRTPVCFLATKLGSDNKIFDQHNNRIELYQAPEVKRFNIAMGWPGVANRAQEAFADSYIKRLKEFGVTITSGSGSARDPMTIERHFRNNNILYSSVQAQNSFGVGGKRPFDVKKKINSKFDLIRIPCLSKPGYKQKLAEPQKMHSYLKYGALYIPGPDEANMFSDWEGCFSEDCQKAFREYLKKEYDSLKDLNESWDTNFKNWDEVVALTANEARQKKSFAGWLDHRTFNDWNRADAFKYLQQGLRKAAPKLKYALSGSSDTNPWNAWDYYLLMQHFEAISSYNGEQVIQQRSFTSKPILSNPWIGYDEDYDTLNAEVHKYLMNGATGFNLYCNFSINPDYTMSRGAKDVINVLKQFRNGPGEAIMKMRINSAPIAFYYSPASIKLNWILGLRNEANSSLLGFKQLLDDAGLQYDYVAYGQLENGGVPEKYKILIMPMITALSDKEVAAITEFVRNGGTILADFLSGSYNQHGKKRNLPALNKLFGISSKGNWQRKEQIVEGKGILEGLKLKTLFTETDIVSAGGEVIATANGVPVAFCNRIGKGKTFYFSNSIMVSYGNMQGVRFSPTHKNTISKFNNLAADIFKHYKIETPATVPGLNNSSLYSLCDNNVKIISIVRDITQTKLIEQNPVERVVNLAQKAHIYNLINGKYLGFGNKFKYAFGPTTQTIFVLLPYKGEKLEIKFTPLGANIKLVAQTKKYADHLFYVQLIDPNGKSNPAYETVIFGKGNEVFYNFKKPLNAISGKWKLQVKEVLTSLSCEVEIP